jgi:hypothetical protein
LLALSPFRYRPQRFRDRTRGTEKGFGAKALIVLSSERTKLITGLTTIGNAGTDLHNKVGAAVGPLYAGAVCRDAGRRSVGADGYGVAARNA